jgi:hypothetical protein
MQLRYAIRGSVTLEMAQNALVAATKVRTFIRQKLERSPER